METLKNKFYCVGFPNGFRLPNKKSKELKANTKAAYRYFSNPNISKDEILDGHFQSTKQRFDEVDGPILVLHDTTEITYNR